MLAFDAASQATIVTALLLPLDFVRPEVLVLAVLFMDKQGGWWRLLFLFLGILNLFLILTLTTLEVQVSQEHVSEVRILLSLIGCPDVVMNCILDLYSLLTTLSHIRRLIILVLILFEEDGAVDLRSQRDFIASYHDLLSYNSCLLCRSNCL